MELPRAIESEEALEDRLSAPTPGLIESFARLDGDLLVLGVGGKMGPSLARMAVRASREAGVRRRVIGASRFGGGEGGGGGGGLRAALEAAGVETVACDLLEPGALERLPRCPNLLYLPARKFGSTGAEWETWATNALLAGDAVRVFRDARIVALSTGNVYPLSPASGPGPDESARLGPVGEYAQSALARERLFEFGSRRQGTPVALVRLNYAVELRYGVLVDLARTILTGAPVDLRMGHANLIWQGDANAFILRCFEICASPPAVLNVTGPAVRIRDLAAALGEALGRPPVLQGREEPTALLANPARCQALFGPPVVPIETVLRWVAAWLGRGGRTLEKPTRFQVRDGSF